MFLVKHRFVAEAYGNIIYNEKLYQTLYGIFCRLVGGYRGIQYDEKALCTDLHFAIKECWIRTDLTLSEIEKELIACMNKAASLNELEFSVHGKTKFFEEFNEKLKNGAYIKE